MTMRTPHLPNQSERAHGTPVRLVLGMTRTVLGLLMMLISMVGSWTLVFLADVPRAHALCAEDPELNDWWRCGREPPERDSSRVPTRGVDGCASAWTNQFYSEDDPEGRNGAITNWWNLHDINFDFHGTTFTTEFTWKDFDQLIKGFNDFTYKRAENDLSPELIFAPIAPSGNNVVQVIARNQIHDQDIKYHHYAWSIDGVTQQGFVAGGLPIDPVDVEKLASTDAAGKPTSKVVIPTTTPTGSVVLPSYNYLLGANPTCRFAHRTPRIDEDGDGMDDDWERRYFPETLDIGQIRPIDDPDTDGYLDKDFVNQNNVDGAINAKRPIPAEYIHIVPDTTAALTYNADSDHWVPNFIGSTTGDGKYSNLEEFIWGTNPTDPDSDDDGYPDEADISGLGQNQMTFRTPPSFKEPERLKIESVAMGKSKIHNRYGHALTDMFPIDQFLYASGGPDFDVQLHVTPGLLYVTRETTIDAIADVINTNHRPGNFDYYWSIKKAEGDASFTILASGESVDPEKKIVSGNTNYPFRGLSHLSWTLTKEMAIAENIRANSLIVLTVDVVDPITHRLKRSEFTIKTADEVTMDIESFNEIGCEMDPEQFQAGGSATFTALAPVEPDDALLFVWYIDGIEQRNQEFSSTGTATLRLPLSRTLLLGMDHVVGVRVYSRHTGRIVGFTEQTITITHLSTRTLTGDDPVRPREGCPAR